VELTEKLLLSMGGWQAFKEARLLHAAGRVIVGLCAAGLER
jgi:hypothetical protein